LRQTLAAEMKGPPLPYGRHVLSRSGSKSHHARPILDLPRIMDTSLNFFKLPIGRPELTRRHVVASLLSCFLFGCDPVRTTTQDVRVAVFNMKDGSPVDQVAVMIKQAWNPPYSDPKWNEKARKNWENRRWFEGVTDGTGSATLHINIAALDWTKDQQPSPQRDHLMNMEWVIKLRIDGAVAESMTVPMTPGAEANGKSYGLKILEIGKPKYLGD
jgi:hypothetical protein